MCLLKMIVFTITVLIMVNVFKDDDDSYWGYH